MKLKLLAIVLLVTVALAGPNIFEFASAVEATPTWLTDYKKALETARTEKKPVLMNFTGSDWCVWCKKLKREVFNTAEFVGYARTNLVLLEIDFPYAKPSKRRIA